MHKRTANVDFIKIDSVGLGSCVQIGDSSLIQGYTRALALQREQEIFFTSETSLAPYEVFYQSLPMPPIDEQVFFDSISSHSVIKVGSIRVLGLAAGALVHVGNTCHIQRENRSMHIRQMENSKKVNDDS